MIRQRVIFYFCHSKNLATGSSNGDTLQQKIFFLLYHPILMRRSVRCLFFLLLVSGWLFSSFVAAQPCLPGWSYRTEVSIDHTVSDEELTNYQVAVVVNTQSLIAEDKLNIDGSDIRFLDENGSVLPHWVEKPTFNTLQTKIWVKVPTIAPRSIKSIYLFYGKAGASDISNGAATFSFFDDFDDVAVNTSRWTTCNDGNFSVANEKLTVSSTNTASGKAIMTSQAAFNTPIIGEAYVDQVGGEGGSFVGLLDLSTGEGYALFYDVFLLNGAPQTTMRLNLFAPDANCFSLNNQVPSPNAVSALETQGVWQLAWPSTGEQTIDWPGASSHPLVRNDASYALPTTVGLAIGNTQRNGSVTYDWVRVRKYTPTEPTTYLENEVAFAADIIATNNGPLCATQSLQLNASTVEGAQYAWTGPNGFLSNEQNPFITETTASMSGTYQVTVSIPAGCSSMTASTEVEISPPTIAGTLSGDTTLCAKDNTGIIKLTDYQGEVIRWEFSRTGFDPWAMIGNQTNQLTYTNMATTTFYRAVVKSGVCEERISNAVAIIVSPKTQGGRAIGSSVTCSEGNTGIVVLSDNVGEVLSWQFSEDDGASYITIDSTTTSLRYRDLRTTTLFRAVVRSGVCDTAYSEPAIITISPLPEVDFSAESVCDGSPTLFQNASTIKSGEIISYLWDFGDGTSSIEQNPSKHYLNPGTYSVKLQATSDQGCTQYLVKKVNVNEFPVANFTVEDVCVGESVVVFNTSSYSSGTLTYEWQFDKQTRSSLSNPTHLYSSAGVYSIHLIVTTALGCQDSLLRYVKVSAPPVVYAGQDTVVSKGFEVKLWATGGQLYSWTPLTGLNNSNISNPVATPLETTTYTVAVTDASGCTATDEVTITVIDDYRAYVSNVLTPNGNGINDTWHIQNIENLGDCTVRVFDRWGKEVYSQVGYQNDWSGYSGTDILPDGTYYYLVTFKGSDKVYQGALNILRNE